jgi:hypothetical protein
VHQDALGDLQGQALGGQAGVTKGGGDVAGQVAAEQVVGGEVDVEEQGAGLGLVRAAAATLPPARVTAADELRDPATNPTASPAASPAANSWNGSRRAGLHSRTEARVAAIVARQSTISEPTRSAGSGRYT